jgi:hypothetical protein
MPPHRGQQRRPGANQDREPSVALATRAPTGVDLAWDVARQNLLTQRDQFKTLDTKAEAVVVLLSAALGGYAVVARALYERLVGGVGLVAAIALVVVGYARARFADAPRVAQFASRASYPPADMKLYFLQAVLDAIHANEKQLRWRSIMINSGLVIVAMLGLGVIVVRAFAIDSRGL